MTDLAFRSAKQLASAIRRKKISAVELLDLYVKRGERLNPRINAIVATDLANARKQAKAADAALKRGKVLGPLHGVPMTVKESYDVMGLHTTWGDPKLKDNIAKKDAVSID